MKEKTVLGSFRDIHPEVEVKESKYRFVTVFRGRSEVIVYGEGSDWMLQYARITNHCDGWRRWFAHRADAEEKAREVALEPYRGRGAIDDEPPKPRKNA